MKKKPNLKNGPRLAHVTLASSNTARAPHARARALLGYGPELSRDKPMRNAKVSA